jgi:membrane-bound lytic murein transglycosylase B
MPVSKKAWYGYGGAMGPAQFIPSTWILYESRVAEATGHNPPNPWDAGDAIMAAALYLKDSGAAKRTASAERTAAICYLAGCANAKKKAYAFYGDDVAELSAKYQKQIDILGG